jgi:hypothetical protein
VVADDVRFANEAVAVVTLGGYVLRIERVGAGSASGAAHDSEMQTFEATAQLRNDGSIRDLGRSVEAALGYLVDQPDRR